MGTTGGQATFAGWPARLLRDGQYQRQLTRLTMPWQSKYPLYELRWGLRWSATNHVTSALYYFHRLYNLPPSWRFCLQKVRLEAKKTATQGTIFTIKLHRTRITKLAAHTFHSWNVFSIAALTWHYRLDLLLTAAPLWVTGHNAYCILAFGLPQASKTRKNK